MMGKTLGHYRVLEKLGEGGMGVVYRAHDTKLGRNVALKVLPTAVARDEERLARFQREAHVLASLNHPNVAAIYGIEDEGETGFLVMELVEGETLAERIGRGPLSVEEAVSLFEQIARGLEAAHEKGIVHRDLKPANVKIAPGGNVKVLDFGLAKVFGAEVAGSTRSESPTITRRGTETGVILGTAAYMSPEQARGQPLDKRTDIWSFGCCLYEALSGRTVFLGETVSDTLAQILQTEPDWGALPQAMPPRVREVIARCLVKDSENRLRDIGDARIELATAFAAVENTPPVQRTSRRTAVTTAVAVVASVLALWSWMRSSDTVPAAVIRSVLPLPDDSALQNDVGAPSVAISPDGRHLAYVVDGGDGTSLYLRALEDLHDTMIEQGNLRAAFFSTDSQWLGFEKDRRLMKVSVSGGAPRLMSELRGSAYGAVWSGEGIFFSEDVGSSLWRIPDGGGDREQVSLLDEARRDKTHRLPEALPAGSGVLFTLATSTTESYDDALVAVLLPSGEMRILLEGGMNPHYSSTGHIVYGRAGSLLAVPFDLESLTVTGQPVPVLSGVLTSESGGAAQFGLAENGTLVYAPGVGRTEHRRVVWVDREGRTETLIESARPFSGPRLSPDGRYLLVQVQGGIETIWLYDIKRATLSRLTSEWDNGVPVWAPSGREMAFASARAGAWDLYRQAIDGDGDAERLVRSAFTKIPSSWSSDGTFLAYHELTGETGADLWMVSPEGEPEPQPFLKTRSDERWAVFSPNGMWIAYQSDESGRNEIYVRRFPGAADKRQVSTDGGTNPVWARDGRELFYRNGHEVVAVPVGSEESLVLGRPTVLFERPLTPTSFNNFDVMPDGQRFVDLDDSVAEASPTYLVLVQNFDEELKRLVPPGK